MENINLPKMKWRFWKNGMVVFFVILLTTSVESTEDSLKCPSLCKCTKTSMRIKIKCGGTENNKVTSVRDLNLNKLSKSIIQLDLSENSILTVPFDSFAVMDLRSLQKLNLSKNLIESIDAEAFVNLTSLKRLDLSRNKLQTIESFIFTGLENLERLSLSQNHMISIPNGAFNSLISLKQLDISGNPLLCDCKLLWLSDWVQNTSVKLVPSPKCFSPSAFRGQPVRKSYTDDGMKCSSSTRSVDQPLELNPAHNQVVFEGDPLQLRCTVPGVFENRNDVHLSWFWGDKEAVTAFQEVEVVNQYIAERGLVESFLSIKHLNQEHNGQWYCHLVSENGNNTQAIHVIVISEKTQYCPQKETHSNKGHYLWPKTVVGFTVELPCVGKSNKSGGSPPAKAQYTCTSDGSWNFLNVNRCPYTSETTKILEQFIQVNLNMSSEAVTDSARKLKNFIGEGKNLQDTMDVVFISRMFEKYLAYITQEKELGALLVDIVSTLMNLPKELMRSAQIKDRACSRLVAAIENVAEFTSSLQSHKSNLAVEVNRIKRETFTGLSCTWFVHNSKLPGRWFHCSSSNTTAFVGGSKPFDLHVIEAAIQVPPSLFYQLEKQGTSMSSPHQLLVSMYENNNLFPRVSIEDNYDVPSCIIGTRLIGQEVHNLTEPVYVMFKAPDTLYHSSKSPRPVWWDQSLDSGIGGWNQDGCHLSQFVHGLLIFQCNRLGYFGLLQKRDPLFLFDSRGQGAKFRFSHPAIYVGSFVCVICLTTAIVTYGVCYSSIQMSKKTKHSLANTWIAMALLCFMYSTGIYQTEDVKVCQGVGIVLHYLSLSSLLWMTVNVSNMYKGLTKGDSLDTLPEDELPPEQPVAQKPLLGLYLIGWGVALIVCGISGAVNMPEYASHWQCFLSSGPTLSAVFVPAGILISFLLVVFLLTHCAARNIDANGQHSEGTQVTENVDLDMLDSNITSNGCVGERMSLHSASTPTASSEVEDLEHSPPMQLKAHAITLLLYILTWSSGALAVAKPFKGHLPYEEAVFSILYTLLSTGLGSFVVFFYCVARSDVRSQWLLMKCWCKKRQSRCCRTRSISDTNPTFPHAHPVPTSVIAHSTGVVVSSTNSINSSSHKSQNSSVAKAATELNGVVQTTVKSDLESGSSENKSNVDLVVLHRQLYRSNNSVTTFTDLSGTSGAEVFYNPHQSTVARKFFRKQRRQAKALCPRQPVDIRRESWKCDSGNHLENARYISASTEKADDQNSHKKLTSSNDKENSHKNCTVNVNCVKENGLPAERFVIGAEEAPSCGSFHACSSPQEETNNIDPVEEVSEEVTSLTAEVGETESDVQCGLTNASVDFASELDTSESVSCRTSNGALSTLYDTQNFITDHYKWQDHIELKSDPDVSDNCSYRSTDHKCSSNATRSSTERDIDEVRLHSDKCGDEILSNTDVSGQGRDSFRGCVLPVCTKSGEIISARTSNACVCDMPYSDDDCSVPVNKRETSV